MLAAANQERCGKVCS